MNSEKRNKKMKAREASKGRAEARGSAMWATMS